jgi:hypothetical protein
MLRVGLNLIGALLLRFCVAVHQDSDENVEQNHLHLRGWLRQTCAKSEQTAKSRMATNANNLLRSEHRHLWHILTAPIRVHARQLAQQSTCTGHSKTSTKKAQIWKKRFPMRASM